MTGMPGFFHFDLVGAAMSGCPINIHPMLPMRMNRRQLPSRAWHKNAAGYRARVEKKWRKRFGTDLIHIIRTPRGFLVSKGCYQELERHLRLRVTRDMQPLSEVMP